MEDELSIQDVVDYLQRETDKCTENYVYVPQSNVKQKIYKLNDTFKKYYRSATKLELKSRADWLIMKCKDNFTASRVYNVLVAIDRRRIELIKSSNTIIIHKSNLNVVTLNN